MAHGVVIYFAGAAGDGVGCFSAWLPIPPGGLKPARMLCVTRSRRCHAVTATILIPLLPPLIAHYCNVKRISSKPSVTVPLLAPGLEFANLRDA